MEGLLRAFAEIAEYRVRLRQAGTLTALTVEIEPAGGPPGEAARPRAEKDLARRVAAAIEEKFFFRPEVRLVPPGALPRFELKARRFIKETSEATWR
jgi:phenylacetate-CoA ligase